MCVCVSFSRIYFVALARSSRSMLNDIISRFLVLFLTWKQMPFSDLLSLCVHLCVRICVYKRGSDWIRNGYYILLNAFLASFSTWWNVFLCSYCYNESITYFLWLNHSGQKQSLHGLLFICLMYFYICYVNIYDFCIKMFKLDWFIVSIVKVLKIELGRFSSLFILFIQWKLIDPLVSKSISVASLSAKIFPRY